MRATVKVATFRRPQVYTVGSILAGSSLIKNKKKIIVSLLGQTNSKFVTFLF